jgi:hypothetical protein
MRPALAFSTPSRRPCVLASKCLTFTGCNSLRLWTVADVLPCENFAFRANATRCVLVMDVSFLSRSGVGVDSESTSVHRRGYSECSCHLGHPRTARCSRHCTTSRRAQTDDDGSQAVGRHTGPLRRGSHIIRCCSPLARLLPTWKGIRRHHDPSPHCDAAFDRNGNVGRQRVVRKDPVCRTCAFGETPARSLY